MSIPCPHYSPDPTRRDGGSCAIGQYGDHPSHGTCLIQCEHGPQMPTAEGVELAMRMNSQRPVTPPQPYQRPGLLKQAAPPTAQSPWDFGPGSALKAAIKAVTGEVPSPNCSCTARAKKMNEWGWIGCIKNRKQILAWLVEEAKKRGHDINGRQSLGVFRAAWKEVRGREASGSA